MAVGLAAALIVVVAAVARRKALRPTWAWNEVAITLVVGGRLSEIFLAELRAVRLEAGRLVFESERGSVDIDARWVVAPFVHALASACGRSVHELEAALANGTHAELWRGSPGSFRLPPM